MTKNIGTPDRIMRLIIGIVLVVVAMVWVTAVWLQVALIILAVFSLYEAQAVESYVRANIGTITPEKPVMGGSWYVVSVTVDPVTDTGHVVYEDGHIQGEADFTYSIKNGAVTALQIIRN